MIICVRHSNRGCPILAFFARVGGDAACGTRLVATQHGSTNSRLHFRPPSVAENANEGSSIPFMAAAGSKARYSPTGPRSRGTRPKPRNLYHREHRDHRNKLALTESPIERRSALCPLLAGGPPFMIICVCHSNRGCPILAFLQGWVAMLHALPGWLRRNMDQQSRACISDCRPSQRTRTTGHPPSYGASEIKSPPLSNRTKKPGRPPKTSKSLPQRTQRSQKKTQRSFAFSAISFAFSACSAVKSFLKRLLPSGRSNEEVRFVHCCRHRHVKESHHHFVVGLVAPLDRTVGIGVVRVIF